MSLLWPHPFGAVEAHDQVTKGIAAFGEIVELIVRGASGREKHDRLLGGGAARIVRGRLDGARERAAMDVIDVIPELAGKVFRSLPDQISADDSRVERFKPS